MLQDHLERIQRLIGPGFKASIKQGLLVIGPCDYEADVDISAEELAMSDKELAEKVLEPMLFSILWTIDDERPYGLTRKQQDIESAKAAVEHHQNGQG